MDKSKAAVNGSIVKCMSKLKAAVHGSFIKFVVNHCRSRILINAD